MTYTARAEAVGPYLVLVAFLPWPEWDKNDRDVPNCVRRESKAEGGRLYFKPDAGMWKMSAEAKAYRAHLVGLVAPVLPAVPWYAALPWEAQLTQVRPEGARADVDHHAGVMDDMIAAGLAKDDRYCTGLDLRSALAADPTGGGLWWYSRQLQK